MAAENEKNPRREKPVGDEFYLLYNMSQAQGSLRADSKSVVEISLEKACKAGAVTSLVLCHLVNGVVDCVIAELLSPLSYFELALASACLCSGARFFLVEGVTTSPRSSANLEACSASSYAYLL